MVQTFDPNKPFEVVEAPVFDQSRQFSFVSAPVEDPTAAGIPNFEETQRILGRTPEETAAEEQFIREINLERRGPDPLARIGSAFTQPFEETEFGLSRETIDRFKQSPSATLNAINEVIVGGVASGGLAALQGIGALTEGTIASLKQAAIELGADISDANTFERNANALLETAGIVTGARPPTVNITQTARRFPGESQRIVDEANLPARLPLTRGDVTQDVNIQSFEDEVLQGLHGPQAQARLQAFRDQQDQALRANVEEIQRGVSGRPLAATPEEAGLGASQAATAAQRAERTSREVVNRAYETAKSFDASIDGEALQALGPRVRADLVNDGFDVAEMPNLSKRIDEISNLKLVDGKLSEATLNNIEVLRKRINKNIQTAQRNDPSEAQGLRILKRQLDTHVEEAFNESLIRGNAEAVDVWKKARELRTEFGKTFTEDAFVRKIINEDLNQEEVINSFFGGSQMGFKTQSARNIKNIKRILGSESEAFRALKEEAILRLTKNQSDATTFSGAKFNTAVEKAFKNNQSLMDELFTKAEQGDIRTFARLAKQVTDRKAGAVNQSATFNKLARFAARSKLPFLGDVLDAFVKFRGERRALEQIEQNLTVAQTVAQFKRDPALFRQAVAVNFAVREDE